jgi:hypothetical protein
VESYFTLCNFFSRNNANTIIKFLGNFKHPIYTTGATRANYVQFIALCVTAVVSSKQSKSLFKKLKTTEFLLQLIK